MAREMKDSGIEWIGEIPSNWNMIRNKYLFDCSKGIVGEDWASTQLLSLTTKGIIEKDPEHLSGKVPESFETYQVVVPDNIVMCLFDLDCSAVFSGISRFKGMISPAYKVLSCKEIIHPHFADLWFSFVFSGRKYKSYSKNLRYTLNYDEFAVIETPIPPLDEQSRIAAFLDRKCAEIDSVMADTRRTIEEYKALKQSIITEAVTKGVRGKRPMKNSGIEWIGKIPEEWNTKKLKSICRKITDGSHFSPETVDEGIPYITAKDVHGVGIDYESACKITKDAFYQMEKAGCGPENGDVLIVKDGATTGRVGMIISDEPCVLLSSVAMLHTNDGNYNRYLMYFMQSTIMQEQIQLSMAGSAMPRITLKKIVDFVMVVPPIEEQTEISAYLDINCSEIERIIENKLQLLNELESYKKSVIYEYVTGKKEVPECP